MDKMNDELRPEYDLRTLLKGSVRGKYAERYRAGTNLVLLEPDVAKVFRSAEAVNEPLPILLSLTSGGEDSLSGQRIHEGGPRPKQEPTPQRSRSGTSWDSG